MKDKIHLKNKLLEACLLFVENRSLTISAIIKSAQKALQSETKSSAGDKHETGRAMIQLEMEKASLQLASVNQMNETLDKIKFQSESDTAKLGSLVLTSIGNYFLSISAGEININDKIFFAVSLSSPIGKVLLGMKQGDKILFNGNQIKILEVL